MFEPTSALLPTLRILEPLADRKITWDPKTLRIISDNDCIYELKSDPVIQGELQSIARTGTKGAREVWEENRRENFTRTLDKFGHEQTIVRLEAVPEFRTSG